MLPTRRLVLNTTLALAAANLAGIRLSPALAATPAIADPSLADRAVGIADAATVVDEWLSFTCHFCAHFKAGIFPEVKAKLIDTGRLRLVFHEYPRDQADLLATMVARSLPANRYEPFMDTLLATQARWAFDRSVEPKDELAKMAALAGMPREMFDRVTTDDDLKAEILAAQSRAEQAYNINATPTFVVNGQSHAGEPGLSYQAFTKMLPA